MDALSEIVRSIRLDSAIYLHAEFAEPWCLTSPEACELAPLLADPAAHVIIYHLLCDGLAYVELPGGNRLELVPGDIISFPHGHAHVLGQGAARRSIDAALVLPEILARGLELVNVGGGGPASRFICGFLACDPRMAQTFLAGLPPLVRINLRDDPSGQWLENSLRFAVAQAATSDPGAKAVLAKLAEVFFAETLRRYARELPGDVGGWLAAARDPEIGRALARLHQAPAHPWTLAELAREAGVSRTVLTERFGRFLGEPPMTYLTNWRLQLGARALTSTAQGIAEIAAGVGYESEASFNRAFKRAFGQPPAAYRKAHSAPR